jgi:hypothetical protein
VRYVWVIRKERRSPWPRSLKARVCGRSLAGFWIRIPPPAAWMSVSCECCVLSGRGLCVELITLTGESYRVWRVWVWSCSLDNQQALAHWGLSRHWKKIRNKYQSKCWNTRNSDETRKSVTLALAGPLWTVRWTLYFVGHDGDGQVRHTAADDACLRHHATCVTPFLFYLNELPYTADVKFSKAISLSLHSSRPSC